MTCPAAHVHGDVRDGPRGRFGGEEDEVAGSERPPSNRPADLCLQGGGAGQEQAESVIDGVGQSGAIEAKGRGPRPQISHSQELLGGATSWWPLGGGGEVLCARTATAELGISAAAPVGVCTMVKAPLWPSTGSLVLKLRRRRRGPALPVTVCPKNQASPGHDGDERRGRGFGRVRTDRRPAIGGAGAAALGAITSWRAGSQPG